MSGSIKDNRAYINLMSIIEIFPPQVVRGRFVLSRPAEALT